MPVCAVGRFGAGGAEIPMCDPFISPIMRLSTRRISSGVFAPAIIGAYAVCTADQSVPWNSGS